MIQEPQPQTSLGLTQLRPLNPGWEVTALPPPPHTHTHSVTALSAPDLDSFPLPKGMGRPRCAQTSAFNIDTKPATDHDHTQFLLRIPNSPSGKEGRSRDPRLGRPASALAGQSPLGLGWGLQDTGSPSPSLCLLTEAAWSESRAAGGHEEQFDSRLISPPPATCEGP